MPRPMPSLTLDTSLRLWSENVKLSVMLHDSGFHIGHSHVIDEPIRIEGKNSNRLAQRHFVSLDPEKVDSSDKLDLWIRNVTSKLTHNARIIDEIRKGHVEALIWIAVFGDHLASPPEISSDNLELCSALSLKIMIENYTDCDADGVAKRVWIL